MNLFENLQVLNESESDVSNKNRKRFLRETIEMLTEIREQPLIPKQGNELIYEIYNKTLELKALFEDVENERNISWDNVNSDKDLDDYFAKYGEDITESNTSKNNGEFFKKVKQAKETLSHYTVKQVDFVKRAYEDVLADIGDAFLSERGSDSSKIKNDYISIAVEDNIMTVEEFETIYKALEIIGVFYAHANA